MKGPYESPIPADSACPPFSGSKMVEDVDAAESDFLSPSVLHSEAA